MPRVVDWRRAVFLLPGVAFVFFSFRSGGYFPGAAATVAVVLCALFVLRLTATSHPLTGFSVPLLIAIAALALFAVWTLVSSSWSGTGGRSALEYSRALCYLLALAFFGSFARTPERLAWLARGIALAAFVVCAIGVLSRIRPDLWSTSSVSADTTRLSYPLSYWNAMGLVGSIGALLNLGLTTSHREPRVVRVLAAGAIPVTLVSLYLTLSRGSMGVAAGGLVVLLAVARPRHWLTGLVTLVASVPLLLRAHAAGGLTSVDPRTPEALAQGRGLVGVVLGAVAAALVIRALGLLVDARVDAWSERRRPLPRLVVGGGLAAGVAAVLLVAVALGAVGEARDRYHQFVDDQGAVTVDPRDRLLSVGNNGRLPQWKENLRGFRAEPLHGMGAGSFQWRWARDRPTTSPAVDGHSLYLEVMGELGIVGLVLVVVALVAVLGGLLALARGPDRGVPGALFAAGVAWAVHAGIDWDWEMPAVTFWLWCAGGAALALPHGARKVWFPGRYARVLAAIGMIVLAVLPWEVRTSQGDLVRGVRAYAANDCPTAIDASLKSLKAIAGRPEPHEVIASCDLRLGYGQLALTQARAGTDVDPQWWEPWYTLALVQGSLGQDPRAAAARAHRLNPLEPMTIEMVRAFRTDSERRWVRAAGRLPSILTS